MSTEPDRRALLTEGVRAAVLRTIGRLIYRRGFDPRIDYDAAQVDRLRAAVQRHPGILLWSHRSNLDAVELSAAVQEPGLPPAHVFAGTDTTFGPMGAILRRAGVNAIRGTISDDPLHQYVLTEYVGYLLEKRFNLSWPIEGTRSRTGTMLPPRLGLLTHAAQAYLEGRTDDIWLLPVSIAFDRLHEVAEQAELAELARGGQQGPAGPGRLARFAAVQGPRHRGKAYVRFGEPVSLRAYLGPPERVAADPAARRLALRKSAFEVAWRIDQELPVTAAALVSTLLLGMHGTALTFEEIRLGLADALAYLQRRDIPRTASLRALSEPGNLRATLDALSGGGPVTCSAGGREPVWAIGPDGQPAAAAHRDSLIHFMLDTALCELALLGAAEAGADPVAAFWAEIARLRDLLRFQFSFRDRDIHRRQVAEEMARHDPAWEKRLAEGPDGVAALLSGMRPLVSHIVLRPFLDAYRIVADVLAAGTGTPEEDRVVRDALGLGRQYVAQRRLRSTEPVSVPLIRTALLLARNRGLLEPGPVVPEWRELFRAELRDLVRRLDRTEDFAVRRYLRDAAGPART